MSIFTRLKLTIREIVESIADYFFQLHVQEHMAFDEEKLSTVYFNEPYSSVSNCGGRYTGAMFAPVYAVMLCLYKVFGTPSIPVYGISTNINEIDPSVEKLVVTIETTQPGRFIGKRGTTMDDISKEIKEFFHINKVEINLKEVDTIHKSVEY